MFEGAGGKVLMCWVGAAGVTMNADGVRRMRMDNKAAKRVWSAVKVRVVGSFVQQKAGHSIL